MSRDGLPEPPENICCAVLDVYGSQPYIQKGKPAPVVVSPIQTRLGNRNAEQIDADIWHQNDKEIIKRSRSVGSLQYTIQTLVGV